MWLRRLHISIGNHFHDFGKTFQVATFFKTLVCVQNYFTPRSYKFLESITCISTFNTVHLQAIFSQKLANEKYFHPCAAFSPILASCVVNRRREKSQTVRHIYTTNLSPHANRVPTKKSNKYFLSSITENR